jgi:hypothetical protein
MNRKCESNPVSITCIFKEGSTTPYICLVFEDPQIDGHVAQVVGMHSEHQGHTVEDAIAAVQEHLNSLPPPLPLAELTMRGVSNRNLELLLELMVDAIVPATADVNTLDSPYVQWSVYCRGDAMLRSETDRLDDLTFLILMLDQYTIHGSNAVAQGQHINRVYSLADRSLNPPFPKYDTILLREIAGLFALIQQTTVKIRSKMARGKHLRLVVSNP